MAKGGRRKRKGGSKPNEPPPSSTGSSFWLPILGMSLIVLTIGLLFFAKQHFHRTDARASLLSSPSAVTSEEDTCIESDRINEAFVAWFEQNGGYLSDKVHLKQTKKSGRGLHVAENSDGAVEEDEILMRVPMKLIKTPDKVQQKIGNMLQTLSPKMQKDGLEAMKLLQEKKFVIESTGQSYQTSPNVFVAIDLMLELSLGESSFFRPYLATFPTYVPRPSSWTDDELMELQNTQLIQMAQSKREGQKQMWDQAVKPLMQILSKTRISNDNSNDNGTSSWDTSILLDFDVFDRFLSLCSTHALRLEQGVHLIPMADKINFERNPRASSKSFKKNHKLENDVVTVRSERRYGVNDEIFEDYSELLDLHGCMLRGMVIDNDATMQHLASIPVPPLKGIAVTVQRHLGIAPRSIVRASSLDIVYDRQDWHYLSLVCLLQDMPEQQAKVRQLLLENKNNLDDVTTKQELERVACLYPNVKELTKKKLLGLAQAAFANLPTSLADDRRLLSDAVARQKQERQLAVASTVNARQQKRIEHLVLAIRFRIKEKEALQRFIQTQTM